MVYRNNACRMGDDFISVCLQTRLLGHFNGFKVPEPPCILITFLIPLMTIHLKIRRPVRRRKRRRPNWRRLKTMWSSFSVGGGVCEELAVGDIHVFLTETSTFDEIQA